VNKFLDGNAPELRHRPKFRLFSSFWLPFFPFNAGDAASFRIILQSVADTV
jgi:hypothetical protein